MTLATLELERDGPILRVWLNRPERRNAVNQRMLRELGDLFLALQTDFAIRVVVLGGRGRSFCAGADRKGDEAPLSAGDAGERERRWFGQLGHRACLAIQDCDAVTLARVHGHAIGGGACLALACDFRILADGSVFRVPEVELGVPLSWGGVPRLIHEVGAARAREILLLCRDIDAERAERWGLAHEVVGLEDLDTAVARLTEELLAKPELAVHMTKTQLRGYARRAALGDASEADGDLIARALGRPGSGERFRL